MAIGSHPWRRATILVGLAMFAWLRPASAQEHRHSSVAPRYELWGAMTGAPSGPTGELATSYSPPLLLDGNYTSHGGQTLNAASDPAIGCSAGINVFATPHVGLQVLLDRVSFPVSGLNPAYAWRLQYTTRLPPNNEPQAVSVTQSVAWPDTSGTLRELVVGFNAVARFGRPDHVEFTVSGGPDYVRISGTAQPVGYTAFQLGGHSVLFEDDYRLAMSIDTATALRFNLGGDLTIAVARRAAVLLGYRYVGGANIAVSLRPGAILNPDQLFFQQALDDVAARIAPVSMRLSPSGSRVLAGLTVRFH